MLSLKSDLPKFLTSPNPDMSTRYFIRSRRLCEQVRGGRVQIGFREMTLAEVQKQLGKRYDDYVRLGPAAVPRSSKS
jgi:hypothetical protein